MPKYKYLGNSKLLVGLVVALAGLAIVVLGQIHKPSVAPAFVAPQVSARPDPVVSGAGVEAPKADWRLSIPSLKIDTAIQPVGLTKEGNMGVPSSESDVGWLKQGPKPGEAGNAVLAGHFDSARGGSAVFYNLHKLKPGDYIYVKEKDKQQRFRVVGSEAYKVSEAPLAKIFGGTTKAQLNLITCNGTWDKKKQDYDKRLVVFTELAQP